MERFKRTASLIGQDALDKLNNSRVAVFGAGGVGGFAIEALARCGVGAIDIIDNDTVSESNINRQIIATYKTIGKLKTEAFKERILEINPDCKVTLFSIFYGSDTAELIDLSAYDYIVDAIDTVTAKTELIVRAKNLSIPVISCMGTGNKLNPTAFKIADISKTSYCPLAKAMRKQLKERGIEKGVKVLYSEEPNFAPVMVDNADFKGKGLAPASISFVPSVAGLIIAGEVIKDIIKINR